MGYSKMKLEIFRNVFMEKSRKVSWDFYSWVSQTLGPGAEAGITSSLVKT